MSVDKSPAASTSRSKERAARRDRRPKSSVDNSWRDRNCGRHGPHEQPGQQQRRAFGREHQNEVPAAVIPMAPRSANSRRRSSAFLRSTAPEPTCTRGTARDPPSVGNVDRYVFSTRWNSVETGPGRRDVSAVIGERILQLIAEDDALLAGASTSQNLIPRPVRKELTEWRVGHDQFPLEETVSERRYYAKSHRMSAAGDDDVVAELPFEDVGQRVGVRNHWHRAVGQLVLATAARDSHVRRRFYRQRLVKHESTGRNELSTSAKDARRLGDVQIETTGVVAGRSRNDATDVPVEVPRD